MATKSWSDIQSRSKISPERREQIRQEVRNEIERTRMQLAQLRRAQGMTQSTLATTMEMSQGDVSKLEHRTDTYISTLRNYVKALGGDLRIVAAFPDGPEIEIEGFGEIATRLEEREPTPARTREYAQSR